jgi:outer membrane lipoprotein SlyB
MDDTKILTALERQPLTVENIAYGLGLPVDETREIILRLLHEGYIDTTTSVSSGITIGAIVGSTIFGGLIAGPIGAAIGAVLGNQLSSTGSQKKRIPSDSQTYFILTSKGHYRLHPLLPNNS